MPMDDVWNCSGSITFNSELTKEDWDKIADLEMENTPRIAFITPQGRQVLYVKCDVLDKITNEIEEYRKYCDDNLTAMTFGHIKQIINKYKDDGSSEGKEWKSRS